MGDDNRPQPVQRRRSVHELPSWKQDLAQAILPGKLPGLCRVPSADEATRWWGAALSCVRREAVAIIWSDARTPRRKGRSAGRATRRITVVAREARPAALAVAAAPQAVVRDS